jgi:hypothetical protein
MPQRNLRPRPSPARSGSPATRARHTVTRRVHPPWWRSWLTVVLALLAGSIVVYLLIALWWIKNR